MSRILRASLLFGAAALLAACSGQTPTSARNPEKPGSPRNELECRSGYVVAYDNGVPVCVPDPNAFGT